MNALGIKASTRTWDRLLIARKIAQSTLTRAILDLRATLEIDTA